MKFIISTIIILIASSNLSWSQVGTTGNPYTYALSIPYEQSGNLKKDLNIDSEKVHSPFSIINSDDEKTFFAYKKYDKSNIRVFKILKENEDYFVLCNEDKETCNCKSGTFLYYKPEKKLQRIEKAFSFSLKNNLIDRLNKFNIPTPKDYEELGFCEIIDSL